MTTRLLATDTSLLFKLHYVLSDMMLKIDMILLTFGAPHPIPS